MAATGTGVTIGARNIRVVQVKKQKDGTWQVLKALIAPLGDAEPSEQRRLAEARSAVTTAQAKGDALIGVSGRDLIMRYTHVPPVPDWRLEMLMNFEIQEVSEQSGGDVSAAYAQLDVDDTTSGDKVVLVALTKNAYLKPRLEAFAGTGIHVLGACPRAVGVYQAYRENGKLGADETVVIVHIGHENTDIAIARNGVLLFARNVAGGGKMLTDAVMQNLRVDAATAEKLKITKGNLTPRGKAKYRDSSEEKVAIAMAQAGGHFVSAINSSVMFAKAQTKVPDCNVSRVVLVGGGALMKGLPEYLESNLNMPVEVFDPMTSVDLSALPAASADALRQDQCGMAAALGLAQLAADERSTRVAILPEAEKKARAFKEKSLFVIAGAAVLFVGLGVAWSMRSGARADGQAEKKLLEERRATYEANATKFTAAKRRVEVVTQQKDTLRQIVAVGPAFQLIHENVQSVLNPGGNAAFDEVYFDKIMAKRTTVMVKVPDLPDPLAREGVEVTFNGTVLQLATRNEATTHAEFVSTLRRRMLELGGLELSDAGGLEQQNHTFKVTVRQIKTPEEVAAEKRAAAAGGGN